MGQKIKYHCKEEGGESCQWFDTEVKEIFKPSDDTNKIEYIVKFAIDKNNYTEWHFPLLTDLKAGLVVIV